MSLPAVASPADALLDGIGFTAEHDHQHHHSRVLLLDSLLGTSADLTHGLGTWLRETKSPPGYTEVALTRHGREESEHFVASN